MLASHFKPEVRTWLGNLEQQNRCGILVVSAALPAEDTDVLSIEARAMARQTLDYPEIFTRKPANSPTTTFHERNLYRRHAEGLEFNRFVLNGVARLGDAVVRAVTNLTPQALASEPAVSKTAIRVIEQKPGGRVPSHRDNLDADLRVSFADRPYRLIYRSGLAHMGGGAELGPAVDTVVKPGDAFVIANGHDCEPLRWQHATLSQDSGDATDAASRYSVMYRLPAELVWDRPDRVE